MIEIEIKIRSYLIDLAKVGSTISYTDLMRKFSLNLNFDLRSDRLYFAKILENILRYENRKKRPFITIIIINRQMDEEFKEYLPSDRFYYIIKSFRSYKSYFLQKNKLEIYKEQSKILFDFWNDSQNYEKHKYFK